MENENKLNKVENVPKNHTVVETVVRRLENLTSQEKNVDAEIARVQKRIDSVLTLKAKIKELKAKKQKLAKRQQNELKDIADLTKFLKATNDAKNSSKKA